MSQKKVYFSLSEGMLERLDNIAKMYGVSRSSFIAMVIGQNVAATEKSLESIPDALKNIVADETGKKKITKR